MVCRVKGVSLERWIRVCHCLHHDGCVVEMYCLKDPADWITTGCVICCQEIVADHRCRRAENDLQYGLTIADSAIEIAVKPLAYVVPQRAASTTILVIKKALWPLCTRAAPARILYIIDEKWLSSTIHQGKAAELNAIVRT